MPDCQYCGAPPVIERHVCGECQDWKCGTQQFCIGGVIDRPSGIYQSAACKQIEEKGGWDD